MIRKISMLHWKIHNQWYPEFLFFWLRFSNHPCDGNRCAITPNCFTIMRQGSILIYKFQKPCCYSFASGSERISLRRKYKRFAAFSSVLDKPFGWIQSGTQLSICQPPNVYKAIGCLTPTAFLRVVLFINFFFSKYMIDMRSYIFSSCPKRIQNVVCW